MKKLETISKEEFSLYMHDLNKSIKKNKEYILGISKPQEDKNGMFHEFSKILIKANSLRAKKRKRFGDFLFSKEFENSIYTEVGNFLGISKENILNKKARNKISASVINNTFQSSDAETNYFLDDFKDLEFRYGENKYIDIPNLYNIYPLAKEEVFSSFFIREDRLFRNNLCVSFSKKNVVKSTAKNGKKFSKVFFDKSMLDDGSYKLESNEAELIHRIETDTRHEKLKIIGPSLIKNWVKVEGHHNFSGVLRFKSISRSVTSNDLALEAKWTILKKNEDIKKYKEKYEDIYLNDNFVKGNNEKRFYGFRFKNNQKNRKKLLEFFLSKSHIKVANNNSHWLKDDKIDTVIYLATGDFIIDVYKFANVDFPVNPESSYNKTSSIVKMPVSISDVINNIIFRKIERINLCNGPYRDFDETTNVVWDEDWEEYVGHVREFIDLLKTYTKPVDLNDSISFLQSQIEAVTYKLSDKAREASGNLNDSDFIKMLSIAHGKNDVRSIMSNWCAEEKEDYFRPRSNVEILNIIWRFVEEKNQMVKPKYIPFEEVEQYYGDLRFRKEHDVKYIINNLEQNLRKKSVNELKKIDAWLNDEQIRFSEQYYKNFEKHPEASSGRYKRIIQKYKKLPPEDVFKEFKRIYYLYTEDEIERYTGKLLKESPQKILKKLNSRLLKRKKEIRQKILDEYDANLKKNLSKPYVHEQTSLTAVYIPHADQHRNRFIEDKMAEEEPLLKKELGYPNKNNILIRFTTNSFNNLKMLEETLSKFEEAKKVLAKRPKGSIFQLSRDDFKAANLIQKLDSELLTPARNNKKDQTEEIKKTIKTKTYEDNEKKMTPIFEAEDEIKRLTSIMRNWLADEETNYFNIRSAKKISYIPKKNSKKWFYYPDYYKGSSSNLMELENMHLDAWDENLKDSIIQMMNLIRMDSDYGNTFLSAINTRKKRISKILPKKYMQAKLSNKVRESYKKELSMIARHHNNDEGCQHFVNDSNLEIFSEEGTALYKNILEKIAVYARIQININKDKYLYGSADSMLRIQIFLDGYNPYQIGPPGRKITPGMSEEIYYYAKQDIQDVIDLYEHTLEKLSHAKFYTTQLYPTHQECLGDFIIIWESLNNFKAIKKYIDLICKYDLYDLVNESYEQNNVRIKKSYISKNDANFLIRKRIKESSLDLKEIKKYLKKNKTAKYLNIDKYRELKRKIKESSFLEMENINGVDSIERTKFIKWLKQRSGSKSLKNFKIIDGNNQIRMSFLPEIDDKKF